MDDCEVLKATMLADIRKKRILSLEAQLAEMRAFIIKMCRSHGTHCGCGWCEESEPILTSTDLGKGWVSPQEHQQLSANYQTAVAHYETGMLQAQAEAAAWQDPERLARIFHETYERLAPTFCYETRKESAVPWDQVPDTNKKLMIAVCREVGGNIGTAAKALLERLEKLEAAASAGKAVRDEMEFAPPNSGCSGYIWVPKTTWQEFCAALDALVVLTVGGKGWMSREEHKQILDEYVTEHGRITEVYYKAMKRAEARFCEAHRVAEVGETCPCCAAVAMFDKVKQANVVP